MTPCFPTHIVLHPSFVIPAKAEPRYLLTPRRLARGLAFGGVDEGGVAVKLVFLGKLADLAGAPRTDVARPARLARATRHRFRPRWAMRAGGESRVKLAVNGTVLANKAALAAQDGDEVALLPPVSGG